MGLKIKNKKINGCDCCEYKTNCRDKYYFSPYGCKNMKMDKNINEYELTVCLKVKVKADSKENAIMQLLYDEYDNCNPCVQILDNKYISDYINIKNEN